MITTKKDDPKPLLVTKQQRLKAKVDRVKKENEYWQDKVNKSIRGYRDQEMQDLLVQCVRDIDLKKLDGKEKELIMSPMLEATGVEARALRAKMQEFITQQQVQLA